MILMEAARQRLSRLTASKTTLIVALAEELAGAAGLIFLLLAFFNRNQMLGRIGVMLFLASCLISVAARWSQPLGPTEMTSTFWIVMFVVYLAMPPHFSWPTVPEGVALVLAGMGVAFTWGRFRFTRQRRRAASATPAGDQTKAVRR